MKERILVINDTQEILDMFRMILEEEGYEVVLSSIPFKKVSDIERVQPQLIIVDIVFGDEKSGWQMLQLLRMYPATATIPIIVCSAAEQTVREQEGYLVSQGIQIVLKPFNVDALLLAVTHALQMQKNTIENVAEEGKKDD